jgi:hypothetical protein
MATAPNLSDNDGDETAAPNGQQSGSAKNSVFALTDEKLVATLRKWFMEDLRAQKEERENRKLDWRMWAGDQYEKETRDRAKAENRPLLTLNYILPTICAIEGEERSNRQQIKVYGFDDANDDRGAYAFNLLIRSVMNENNGEYSVSGAFRHATIGGAGWLHPDVDYWADPEGMIVVRHVDEDEIVNDSQDTSPDASESRRLTRQRWLAEDQIEAMFPGGVEKIENFAQGGDPSSEEFVGVREGDGRGYRDIYMEPGKTDTKVYDCTRKEWLVLEHWWYEIEPGMAARNQATGDLEELTLEEADAIKQKETDERNTWVANVMAGAQSAIVMPPQPTPMTPRPIRCYYQAFSCGGVMLYKGKSLIPEARRIPYVPIYGYYDKVKKQRFGVVRNIADVQRQTNVEQSAIVHMVQLAPKAGWMAPRGAFHDKQKWMSSAARPGAMLEYNAQKGKPEPIPQPQLPRQLVELAMSRMQQMKAISGVNTEMTGERVASDAGVAMEMRKKAAMTILATLFDNLRLAKKVLGKLLIVYIQAFMPMNRRIRVLGPNDAPMYAQFTQDLQFARFDAAVDETEATVNDRIQTLTLLQTVLPTLIDAGIPIPPGLIDLFPIPPHVRDEWKAMLMGPPQGAPGASPAAPPGGPAPPSPPGGPPPQAPQQ